MASQKTTWILELIDKITSPMGDIGNSVDESKDKVDKLGDSLRNVSAIDLHAISNSVGELKRMLGEVSAPGIAFDSQMKEVQAITGLTGDALDKLGDQARASAKVFGTDASAMLESYKGVIARFGPDIAASDAAMATMGSNIATLSKLMGGDAVGSMDALTTAMLQFGVDLSNPIAAAEEMTRMMNVMAAAGNEGASEVDMTAAALKAAGVQALNANVTFEQTNSALQALAQGGITGSEAGMKLRNVLSKMAGVDVIPKEAAEKLAALGVNYDIVSDKTIPFTDRLRELKKAQGDATVMAQIFGIQNDAAAQILLNSIDAQDELTAKITDTSAAFESAEIIMSSYQERVARTKAWMSDLGISIFGATQYIMPFVDGLGSAVMVLANLANARKGIILLMTTLKGMPIVGGIVNGAFNLMSLGARGLGVAIMSIPIIGWIAAIVAALIALGVYFWKTSAEFRGILMGVWEFIKVAFTGYYKFIWEVMQAIWHVIKGVFDPRNWFDDNYKFSDAFDKVINAAKEYGENLGTAFAEGRAKGMESFYEDNPDKRPGVVGEESGSNSGAMNLEKKNTSPVIPAASLPTRGSNTSSGGLSGSGASGVRSVTQNIEIKNYFNVDGNTNVDSIAERVIRAINDKLRDSTIIAAV